MKLTLVTDEGQIRRSLRTFNMQAGQNRERARKLLYRTVYWVYDADRAAFGPSKFVGFANMDFRTYEWALAEKRAKRRPPGDRHHGHLTWMAIAEALGREYGSSAALAGRLREWAQALLGSGTLVDKDGSGWRFVELPDDPVALTGNPQPPSGPTPWATCIHGVPTYKKCAICDPKGFLDENGDYY